MDKRIVSRLAQAFKKAMEEPSYIKANSDIAMHIPNPLFEDRLTALMGQAFKQNGALARELGIERE
jgi:hypothetical protein